MILCVDPDADARAETTDALEDGGFVVRDCASLSSAEAVLADDGAAIECLVTEYDLPDGTGLDLFRTARETAPDAACVLFTATSLDDVDTAAFGDLVADYLSKEEPHAREELVELVDHAMAFWDQTSYPLPDDEEARLAALDRYTTDAAGLDEALDRLTELAVALFDTDSSAVGLVDAHHEHFISCRGTSVDTLDREDTVCTYAILDEGVTVIEDVASDPRFEDNQSLREAGIRFYAGMPMRTDEGRAVGVFCLFDDRPRTFSEHERHLLSLLGEEAMDQLDLRRQLKDGDVDE